MTVERRGQSDRRRRDNKDDTLLLGIIAEFEQSVGAAA